MTATMLAALIGMIGPASGWLLAPAPPSEEEFSGLLEESPEQAVLLLARTGWLPGSPAVRERVEGLAEEPGRIGRLAAWACTESGLRPDIKMIPGLVELGPETVLPDVAEARDCPDLVHAGLLRALHSAGAGIPMQRPQDAVELAAACWESLPDSSRLLALQAAGHLDVQLPATALAAMGTARLRYLAETGAVAAWHPEHRPRGLEGLYAARCVPDSTLRGMMDHPDWFVRYEAATGLPPEELAPLLEDPVDYVALHAAWQMQQSGLPAGTEAIRKLARLPGPVGDMATARLTADDAELLEELMEARRPARRAAAQGAWLGTDLPVDSTLARRWEGDPYWLLPVSWVYHLEHMGELGRARTSAERIAAMAEESHRPEILLSYLEEIVTGGPAGALEEEAEWPVAELPFDPEEVPRAERVELRTSEGRIVLRLLWDTAPIACANLLHLARDGFYDGIWVHRVEPGFVAQAGCPEGNGMGGPEYTIPGEPSLLPFAGGTVGMADAGPGTAGSQFFIMLDSHRRLDARYTAFARVVEGMDVAERLAVGSRIEAVEIR